MGSRVIKLALMHPITNYPWNSPEWPDFGETGYRSAAELAGHKYYGRRCSNVEVVFEMEWTTIALVAYSTVDWDA
eukprot:gene6987-29573_t